LRHLKASTSVFLSGALALNRSDIFGRVLVGRPKVKFIGAKLNLTLELRRRVPM
jgi:hypothetical protein